MTSKQFQDDIQRFGRSLLLPIAILAPVGMLLGITSAFTQIYLIERLPFLGNATFQMTLKSISSIANVLFSNIPLLFAMGVANGMARKEKNIAVFSSVIGYFVLLATMNVWLTVTGTLVKGSSQEISAAGQAIVFGIQTIRVDALGGMFSGILAAYLTERFYNLQLPLAFAFFGGRKSVPILTIFWMIPIGLILPFFWNFFIEILKSSSALFTSDYIGTFLFGFLNRMLIPFGLHHVQTSIMRFTEAGGTYLINGETFIGIIPATNKLLFDLGPSSPYWDSLGPELFRFGAQNQMLTTLFAFPAIGLAMYHTAYTKNRPYVTPMIITVVLTAFLGNITEPLEFSFMFISPVLYVTHAFLKGIGGVFLYMLGTCVGYIRGTIFDFTIFGLLYENTRWWNLFIVGIPIASIYYFFFKWYILKFNLETPGREAEVLDSSLLLDKKYGEVALIVLEGLGGKGNIKRVENCISRLRVDFVDEKKVNQQRIRESGAAGIFFPSEGHIHVVYGPHVEFVRNALDDIIEGKQEGL